MEDEAFSETLVYLSGPDCGLKFKPLLCLTGEVSFKTTWSMCGVCVLPPLWPWARYMVPECHQKEALVNRFV